MSYSTIEAGIVEQLRTLSYYDSGNCLAENPSKAFNYAMSKGTSSVFGRNVCVIDYGGGSHDSENRLWTHTIRGFCAVLATEPVEGQDVSAEGSQIRTIVDDLKGLFYPRNRLSGLTPRCVLVAITEPFVYKRANLNWMAFFITLEADEERTRC
jgi:hypothetical protein